MWLGTLAAQPASRVNLSFDAATHTVFINGLDGTLPGALAEHIPEPATMNKVFAVYFEDSLIPILGDYTAEGATLRFRPRFPFMPGRTHRAVFDLAALFTLAGRNTPVDTSPLRLTFRIDPAALSPRTRVTQVFPSAEVVPANLLRIYVHFSRPMTRHGIARHVRLLDQNGQPVEAAFLEMEDGLWDPDGQRLTLFLHPGRIKRGLALHEGMGSPLRPGFRYRLVVARETEDEDGLPLIEGFSKEFSVTAEDRTSPDVHKWMVTEPRAGGRQPLIVKADKALDAALFARLLHVENAAGQPLAGDTSVESQETCWRFVPRDIWRSGNYVLRIGARLEDPAGNRPTRLFDELAAPGGRRAQAHEVILRFTIGR